MTSTLRILSFYDCIATESVGGVEERNLQLARELAARGHHVTLAGWASEASQPVPGVRVLPLRRPKPLYTWRSRRSARAALLLAADAARVPLKGIDLVEAANIPYLHLFPLAVRCRAQAKPLCVTWHEYWGARYWRSYLRSPAWPGFAAVERCCAELGAAVTAVSGLTADRLASRRRRPVPVIPNGVPVAEIRRAAERASRPGPPLVYAGRLLPEKRLDLLLTAVKLLRGHGIEGPLLTVIGEGPERQRLERRARDLGVAAQVHFAGRVARSHQVWERLGAARIAVQPSSREGFGLFPLEAMAAGLPVVYCSSAESAVGEVVRDGIEGVACEARSEALAGALSSLLAPDGLPRLAALSVAARTRAEEYSWASVATKVEDLYLGLVGLRRRPAESA